MNISFSNSPSLRISHKGSNCTAKAATPPQLDAAMLQQIAGNRTKLTWNDLFKVSYAYDGLGRITNIVEGDLATGSNLATYAYNGHPSRQSTTLGNGKTVAYDYFLDGAMKQFSQSGIAFGGTDLTLKQVQGRLY
jgi:hypothetical protein